MTADHPITPPPKWQIDAWQACIETMGSDVPGILLDIAQWGADQELEACLEWMKGHLFSGLNLSKQLRAARRPKPPSLKEQALIHFESFAATFETSGGDSDLIRRALEALPDD